MLTERTSGGRSNSRVVHRRVARFDASRVPGNAVFMTSNNERVPNAMLHNLMHNRCCTNACSSSRSGVFDVPYVPRSTASKSPKLKGGFYRVPCSTVSRTSPISWPRSPRASRRDCRST